MEYALIFQVKEVIVCTRTGSERPDVFGCTNRCSEYELDFVLLGSEDEMSSGCVFIVLWRAQIEFWLCDELLIVTGSQNLQQCRGFGVAQVQNGPRASEYKDCTQKLEDHEAPRTPPASHEAVNETVQELKIKHPRSASCRCENINWCCDGSDGGLQVSRGFCWITLGAVDPQLEC